MTDLDIHNQAEADKAFGNDPGHLYRVELPDQPGVTLAAVDSKQAVEKYCNLFGILETTLTFNVRQLGD
jgi:hypothetical protein